MSVAGSDNHTVTLLAILASHAVALPLSPGFPTGELKYIMDNSQAKVLIATEKFANKAQAVIKAGLDREPILDIRDKMQVGANPSESVTLEDLGGLQSQAGMMLYTSGTTSRPVSKRLSRSIHLLECF